uniref:LCCL domain-containing protein n=1 Tax=Macrostomum lignano TaxID=282301 RepID=A0A1I8FSL4_9PLAT
FSQQGFAAPPEAAQQQAAGVGAVPQGPGAQQQQQGATFEDDDMSLQFDADYYDNKSFHGVKDEFTEVVRNRNRKPEPTASRRNNCGGGGGARRRRRRSKIPCWRRRRRVDLEDTAAAVAAAVAEDRALFTTAIENCRQDFAKRKANKSATLTRSSRKIRARGISISIGNGVRTKQLGGTRAERLFEAAGMPFCQPACFCFFLLLACMLISPTLQQRRAPITCYNATKFADPRGNMTCEDGVNTCYEYVYGYHGVSHLTYTAGCGGRIKASYSGANGPVDEYIPTATAKDLCNQKLLPLLLHAKVSRVEPTESVICPPGEHRLLLREVRSRLPFFNAGCGPCPAYTFNCTICHADGVLQCHLWRQHSCHDGTLGLCMDSAAGIGPGLATTAAAALAASVLAACFASVSLFLYAQFPII